MGNACTSRDETADEAQLAHDTVMRQWQQVSEKLGEHQGAADFSRQIYWDECRRRGVTRLQKQDWYEVSVFLLNSSAICNPAIKDKVWRLADRLCLGAGDRFLSEQQFHELMRCAYREAELVLRKDLEGKQAKLRKLREKEGSPVFFESIRPPYESSSPQDQSYWASNPHAANLLGAHGLASRDYSQVPPNASMYGYQQKPPFPPAASYQAQRQQQQQQLWLPAPLQQQQQQQHQQQQQQHQHQQPQPPQENDSQLPDLNLGVGDFDPASLQRRQLLESQRQSQRLPDQQPPLQLPPQQSGISHWSSSINPVPLPGGVDSYSSFNRSGASPAETLQLPASAAKLQELQRKQSEKAEEEWKAWREREQQLAGQQATEVVSPFRTSAFKPEGAGGERSPGGPNCSPGVEDPNFEGAFPVPTVEDVDAMKHQLLTGKFKVFVYGGNLQLQPKHLALNMNTRRLSVLRATDGLCEDSFGTDMLLELYRGVPDHVVPNPAPALVGVALRFSGEEGVDEDKFLCCICETGISCSSFLAAFSELCQVPVVEDRPVA
mmetsp:Transcript_53399/g.114199  ORF Transcript_53399/g.114199 Transcript_53399/m.114199 type:complete len:549 (+) Transcript_53399:80-1726(+)